MALQITSSGEPLLQRIVELAGLDTTAEAARALNATLAALGERLHDRERLALGAALRAELGVVLRPRKHRGEFDLAELYARVRRREGTSLGFAREHAQVVCRVLGEALPEETVRELERALPEPIAELFHPPSRGSVRPERPPLASPPLHTLAAGKPGSGRPLSEAVPPLAHAHSVAGEVNPHADTKLSSAPGLTQERLDESLATDKPDTQRTIGEASD